MPTRLAHSVGIAIVIVTAAFLAAGCSGSPPAVMLAPETATSTPVVEPTRSSNATVAPAAEEQDGGITIGFVGDLMFARDIVRLMQSEGTAYPFERVRPLLAGFDLLVGNLEGTFTDRGEALVKTYTF